jgi:hypothetical protein
MLGSKNHSTQTLIKYNMNRKWNNLVSINENSYNGK